MNPADQHANAASSRFGAACSQRSNSICDDLNGHDGQ